MDSKPHSSSLRNKMAGVSAYSRHSAGNPGDGPLGQFWSAMFSRKNSPMSR
jgi:hypothetical protein